ncbi:hypothetical protein A3850_013380 [Lewinella sp. 4G2]|nr:hypothetical protein A3850_013380 [Lewinella sp. 4G2]
MLGGFVAVSLFSCEPETFTEGAPQQEGFSNPKDMFFDAEELAVLNQELKLSATIEPNVQQLPRHIARFGSPSSIRQSDSDARKALLGRVLFYDKALSATGETSCASCHLQEKAFADPLAFSKGINGAVTKRNSIALGSVPSFAPSISGYGSSPDEESAGVEGTVKFFWDERAKTVKEQSELTIEDELEMGRDLHELSSDLKKLDMYKILSMKAYGTTDLTPDRITLALEKFTSSISSMDTRFDRFQDARAFSQGALFTQFTDSEIRGANIFDQNCATCHSSSLTEPNVAVANNGLDATYTDKGIGELTGEARMNGVFKVPFLRNVALTAPYMHDGRFATLREVIDHYSEGIENHRNLHPTLKGPNFTARKFNYSERDKQALEDFLMMATDESIATDESLSDPFRR